MAVNVIAIEQQAAEVRKTEQAIVKVKREMQKVFMLVEKFIINREPWLKSGHLTAQQYDAISQSIREVKVWGKAEEERLLAKLLFLGKLLEVQKRALAAIKARPPEVDRYGRSRSL